LAYLLAVVGILAIAVVLLIVARLSRQSRFAASQLSGHRIRAGERCPSCRVGMVRVQSGPGGAFLGCSNQEFGVCHAAWTMKGEQLTQPNGGRLPPS
jgi:hypothetical protein